MLPFRKLKQIESVTSIHLTNCNAFKINVAYGIVRTSFYDGGVQLLPTTRMKYKLEMTHMIHGPRDLQRFIA